MTTYHSEPIDGLKIKELPLSEEFLYSLIPEGHKFHRPLFRHQLMTLVFWLQFDSAGASWSDMGSGKTATAIEYLRVKKIKNKILIITMRNLLYVWAEEFKKLAPKEYKVCVLDDSYTIKQKNDMFSKNYDVFVINYDSLFLRDNKKDKEDDSDSGDCKKKKKWYVAEHILPNMNIAWNAIIADESRNVMNPKSKRSRIVAHLARHAKVRIPLCGLPIAKGTEEIFNQQYLCDLGKSLGDNYWNFEKKYYDVILIKNKFKKIKPKEGTADKMREVMYSQGIRFNKSECLDLPEKIFVDREIELYGDCLDFYKKLKSEHQKIIVVGKNHIQVNGILVKFRQITGGFLKNVDEQNKEHIKIFGDNAKFDELVNMIDNEIGEEKSIAIWAYFQSEQEYIYNYLKENGYSVTAIIEGVDDKAAHKAEKDFQSGKKKIIVLSIRKCARGLTLTQAQYAIFYSSDFDSELMQQAYDRHHRIGLKHNVTIVHLVAKHTVDEKVVDIIRTNKQMSDLVIDGVTIGALI